MFERRFLDMPDLVEEQRQQVLKALVDGGSFKSGDDENLEILKESLSREGSFWYRNPALSHYEWDAESLAEGSIDRFINHYLHPFIRRLQIQIQVESEGGISSKEKGVSATDDWLYVAEINHVEWWLSLDSEESRVDNDWPFTIDRYVRVLNIISALSGSDSYLYYQDQGDEVIFIILPKQLHDDLIQWKMLGLVER